MIIILVLIILGCTFFTLLRHPSFGRLPHGDRQDRIERSPHYKNGQFRNRLPTPTMTSEKSPLRNFWNLFFGKNRDRKPSYALPAVKTNLHALNINDDIIVWLGHSSLFIQNGRKRFLVDPVLTNRFPMSLMFKPFEGTNVYTPEDIPAIDYLIITHDHWDHLDYYTVKELKNRTGKVFCGLGVGEHLEYWGFSPEQICEMDWNENMHINDSLTIYCLPTRHFSGRWLSRNKTLWASFLIEGRHKIYLSGDGGYDSHFAEIGNRFPDIDWAIMENGQYNADWKYIHMMPDELPNAIKEIAPRNVLTVHHSKFALSRHNWYEPLSSIKKASRNQTYRLFTPLIGEVVPLTGATETTDRWWENTNNVPSTKQ
mgnify:CR=1 FL=1